MKTFKTEFSYNQSPSQFAQKLKILPGLKSLSIYLPAQIRFDRPIEQIQEKYFFKIAFKKMNRLRNLKHLSLNNLSIGHKDLLEKLNSFPRLLSSLKTFQITCGERSTNNPELLHIIQSKKNIINSMTSVDLGWLCSPSHHTSFQNLADSCPKLQCLRFEFSNRYVISSLYEQRRFSEINFPVEVNYLSALKIFHSIKSLHLNIADTYTCIKDLALPSSIEHLILDFKQCLSKEIMLKIDSTFCTENNSQVFQENQTLLHFYDQFRCLDHLETLNIYWNIDSDSESYQYQNYLLHSLLRRIPTLKNFSSDLSARCEGLNPPLLIDKRDFYLPQFFDSCRPFSQTLQTLEIGHEKIFYSNLDLSASHIQFPQLSSIKITGQFEEFQALNPPILPLLEQLAPLGDSLIKIKLLFKIDPSVKTLLSLLQQISQFKMPTKLYLEMEVKFLDGKDLGDLKEGFEEIIHELGSPENRSLEAKRTSLKISTTRKSKEMKKFLNVFGERFEHFEHFEVKPKRFFF